MMLKVFASPQHLQLSFQKPLKNRAWNWKWLPKFKNCSKRKKNTKKWIWVKIGKICWEKKSNWFRNCNYSNMYYYVKYIFIDTAHSVLSQEYNTNSKKNIPVLVLRNLPVYFLKFIGTSRYVVIPNWCNNFQKYPKQYPVPHLRSQ